MADDPHAHHRSIPPLQQQQQQQPPPFSPGCDRPEQAQLQQPPEITIPPQEQSQRPKQTLEIADSQQPQPQRDEAARKEEQQQERAHRRQPQSSNGRKDGRRRNFGTESQRGEQISRISDSGFWCCTSCAYPRKKTMGSDDGGGDDLGGADLRGVIGADAVPRPEHLVILVNGILGSAADWKFAATRLTEELKGRVAIHCSEASASMKTFDGVDVMGGRLADEVLRVIEQNPGVTKISFLSHSLGGLISRYAISKLYRPPMQNDNFGEGVTDPSANSKITTEAAQSGATIGGLQAENFITLATPHLGCRGSEQLPFLFGIEALEKTAACFAHLVVGRTGKHLFLTDGSRTEQPLLRKMATDCKEGQFISSLGLFKRRTAYANVAHDQLVGWRTASIRRKSELPEIRHVPLDRQYPHVIREEDPVPPSREDLSVVRFGPPLDDSGRQSQDALEEEIVAGLTQVPWHRVDASFRAARWSAQAHNLIQVKTLRLHFEGQDVIEHVIDKQFMREDNR